MQPINSLGERTYLPNVRMTGAGQRYSNLNARTSGLRSIDLLGRTSIWSKTQQPEPLPTELRQNVCLRDRKARLSSDGVCKSKERGRRTFFGLISVDEFIVVVEPRNSSAIRLILILSPYTIITITDFSQMPNSKKVIH